MRVDHRENGGMAVPKNMHRERDQFYSPDFELAIDRRIVTHEYCRDPIHWHDYCELEYVCSGHGVHLLNNQRLELCPGSIYIVMPLDFHRVYAEPDAALDLYHLQLGCSVLSSELMQRITRDQTALHHGIHVCLNGDVRQTVQSGLEQLLSEFSRHMPDGVMLMRACLERLCILILREAEQNGNASNPGYTACETVSGAASPINQAVQYVHYSFRNSVTLAETARRVHLSANYFGELFHASMGMSFNEYLRKCRLEYAHRLLLETGMDVLEVARESGFRTPSHFTDVFRRQYGMTPTEFRRKQSEKVEDPE